MTQSITLDGHRLVAICAGQHDLAARSMLNKFAELHAVGPRLAPGARIDFGWVPLQIEADNGEWLVCEPDFDSEPMQWRPSVDATLGVLQAQGTLMRHLGIQPKRTRGDHLLWLAPSAVRASSVYLHRKESESADKSGWYIGKECSEEDDEETQCAVEVLAGRLLSIKPEWVVVLALPVGYLAQFEEDRLTAIYDDRDQCIFPVQDGKVQ